MRNLLINDRLISTHTFLVTIGLVKLSFSKISNISSSIEYEIIHEGGNNDYPLILKKQKQNPDILKLEKGVQLKAFNKDFNSYREGMTIKMVNIMVLKDRDELVKALFFKEGLIIKREFSTLDAMSNEIMIESLEIAHSGLIEVEVPD